MKSLAQVRGLFVLAGLYDGIIGAAFLLAWAAIFAHFGIAPPNHPGYVQFPALLIIIFALMFFAIAIRPATNRNLIGYGILLKLSYSGTVLYYWFNGGIPGMWKPFAIADLIFAVLFVWAYMRVRSLAR